MFDWYSDSGLGLGGTADSNGDNFSRESRTEKDYNDMSGWAMSKEKSAQSLSYRGDTKEAIKRSNVTSFWDIS